MKAINALDDGQLNVYLSNLCSSLTDVADDVIKVRDGVKSDSETSGCHISLNLQSPWIAALASRYSSAWTLCILTMGSRVYILRLTGGFSLKESIAAHRLTFLFDVSPFFFVLILIRRLAAEREQKLAVRRDVSRANDDSNTDGSNTHGVGGGGRDSMEEEGEEGGQDTEYSVHAGIRIVKEVTRHR